MRLGFLLILVSFTVLSPLRAQEDQPVHMTPEFPLVFPLDQQGRLVTVKYPVMINPTTVLKPGVQLRIMYILSHDTGGSANLVVAHEGTLAESFSRSSNTSGNSANEPDVPPELAHQIETYRRNVWEVANNFILAMAQYPTDMMHLLYSPTGKYQDVRDDRFSFFDGLFVGLPNGKVTVIAVEKESKADAAGIKAGDVIVSVGGMPTRNDLATFASDYSTAKKTATDNEASSYVMTILPSGQGDPKQVNIPLPPRLGGGLMDDFNK